MHHSVNQGALEIVKEILDRKNEVSCSVSETDSGATLIDAGIKCSGSVELGRLIAETSLGGLGAIRLTRMYVGELDLPAVIVSVEQPAVATLGSQRDDWKIKVGKFSALASGPARALARVEAGLFESIHYGDTAKKGVIILESKKLPTESVTDYIAQQCGIAPSNLYCIAVPITSIAWSIQSASKVVETGTHKMYQTGFDVEGIRRGHGVAPIAPLTKDENKSYSFSRDCIIYGGRTFYHVKNDSNDLQGYVERLPASVSEKYGQPFYEILKGVNFDLSKIDPIHFSPAEVTLNHIETGKIYRAGRLNSEALRCTLGL